MTSYQSVIEANKSTYCVYSVSQNKQNSILQNTHSRTMHKHSVLLLLISNPI